MKGQIGDGCWCAIILVGLLRLDWSFGVMAYHKRRSKSPDTKPLQFAQASFWIYLIKYQKLFIRNDMSDLAKRFACCQNDGKVL
ncbi:hypothetical protein B0681_06475 [Moraxella porci DSM 25326]|uniref:Uncharacterized protein n=1 Tax=Moraxella porci DSM 25326 TaxID=573983 RepID=A0A1T0CR09_9GAMM|nr:hypothetical protein B0681_06475 [Moraxella porci DSM 25326]